MLKKKITFQISHLKSLLESEISCVTVVNNFKGKLALLPFHLGYLKHAVKELLNDKVSKYDPELNGIVLGHSNIKVINHLQHSDSCVINLNYVADIYLFTPVVGSNLSGVVNKKTKEFMGCLIHGAFNASIPKPRQVGDDLSIWLRTHGSVEMGSELDFTVSKVDFSSRVPYISGTILRKDWDDQEEEVDSGFSCHDSFDDSERKLKKKKKKLKESANLSVESSPYDSTTYHDPDKISDLLKGNSGLIKGKRKKSEGPGLDDVALSSPPLKKIKKEKRSPCRDAMSPEPQTFPVQIKTERSSVTPMRVLSPPPPGQKCKKRSLQLDESYTDSKVKSEMIVDEPSFENSLNPGHDDAQSTRSDSSKKKKANKSPHQIDKSIKIKKSDSPPFEGSGSPQICEEQVDSNVSKKPKKKKSRSSFDKLADTLLAETLASLK